MANKVILLTVNESYLDHAKSLMVNCVRQGAWQEDFCLLCPTKTDVTSIANRGIALRVLEEPLSSIGCVKFRMFDPWFRQWEQLLYLDCDTLVQGDLNKAFNELAKRLPTVLMDDAHDVTVRQDWVHFDALAGAGEAAHPELYKRLKEKFPFFDEVGYSSDAVFFAPDTIPHCTVAQLDAVQQEFQEANVGGHDQQVMNLILWDQLDGLGKDFCTWWAFDDPGNRVPSKHWGWRGDEVPVWVHYWGAFAPWLIKTPDAGAYNNERLGRVCHELYAENLSLFEKTFPLRS